MSETAARGHGLTRLDNGKIGPCATFRNDLSAARGKKEGTWANGYTDD